MAITRQKSGSGVLSTSERYSEQSGDGARPFLVKFGAQCYTRCLALSSQHSKSSLVHGGVVLDQAEVHKYLSFGWIREVFFNFQCQVRKCRTVLAFSHVFLRSCPLSQRLLRPRESVDGNYSEETNEVNPKPVLRS